MVMDPVQAKLLDIIAAKKKGRRRPVKVEAEAAAPPDQRHQRYRCVEEECSPPRASLRSGSATGSCRLFLRRGPGGYKRSRSGSVAVPGIAGERRKPRRHVVDPSERAGTDARPEFVPASKAPTPQRRAGRASNMPQRRWRHAGCAGAVDQDLAARASTW